MKTANVDPAAMPSLNASLPQPTARLFCVKGICFGSVLGGQYVHNAGGLNFPTGGIPMTGAANGALRGTRFFIATLYLVTGERLAFGVSPCPPLHVTPLDPSGFGNFGYSVAVDGDAAIAGAVSHCHSGHGCGAVYIFRRSGSSWVQEQEIWPAEQGPAESERFGAAVAIDGDVALIGADNHVRSGFGKIGAAYVFRRGSSGWMEEQELLHPDGMSANFGWSVALSGSIALVGAPNDDTSATNAGAVYVFRFNGSQWLYEQRLLASDAQSSDGFGISVAIDGDVALIGASGDDDAAPHAGASYVFRFNPKTSLWVQEQKLLPDPDIEADFGWSVSVNGTIALIGARGESCCGTAYFFEYSGFKWVRTQKLFSPVTSGIPQFGISVSINSDFAVIGDLSSSVAGPQTGAAFLYRFNGHSWVQHGPTLVHNPGGGPFFGFSVGISNGTTIIGANGESAPFGQSGAAYIYNVDPAPADLNCDNVVNTLDLGMLLVNWSIPERAPGCGGAQPCPADINGDGFVNTLDLGMLLSSWTL